MEERRFSAAAGAKHPAALAPEAVLVEPIRNTSPVWYMVLAGSIDELINADPD